MSNNIERTAEDVKKTVAILKELLAEIDPSARISSQGALEYGELGLSIIFGENVAGCGGGCFGCGGCDGCSGCDSTASAASNPADQVSNPSPVRG